MNIKGKRQVVLDTETTGINVKGDFYIGHRIIEIAAFEIINRKITKNFFHTYLNPNRKVDFEAYKVHKISDKFLLDKPSFGSIRSKFFKFIKNSVLIIHNAMFDIQFLNNELNILKYRNYKMEDFYEVIDTLQMARNIFPGKKNNLNALCDRYSIQRNNRLIHSAKVDAFLLAKVYLSMTKHQKVIDFKNCFQNEKTMNSYNFLKKRKIKVILASNKEILEHENYLRLLLKK